MTKLSWFGLLLAFLVLEVMLSSAENALLTQNLSTWVNKMPTEKELRCLIAQLSNDREVPSRFPKALEETLQRCNQSAGNLRQGLQPLSADIICQGWESINDCTSPITQAVGVCWGNGADVINAVVDLGMRLVCTLAHWIPNQAEIECLGKRDSKDVSMSQLLEGWGSCRKLILSLDSESVNDFKEICDGWQDSKLCLLPLNLEVGKCWSRGTEIINMVIDYGVPFLCTYVNWLPNREEFECLRPKLLSTLRGTISGCAAEVSRLNPWQAIDAKFFCQTWPKVQTCMQPGMNSLDTCWKKSSQIVNSIVEFLMNPTCGNQTERQDRLGPILGGISCIDANFQEVMECTWKNITKKAPRFKFFSNHPQCTENTCIVVREALDCSNATLKPCENSTAHTVVTSILMKASERLNCPAVAATHYDECLEDPRRKFIQEVNGNELSEPFIGAKERTANSGGYFGAEYFFPKFLVPTISLMVSTFF